MKSINKLVLEPYQYQNKIKPKVSGGFQGIEQKTKIVGLKLITDAVIIINNSELEFKKGQKAYFPEEVLHNANWSKTEYENDDMSEKFIVAPFNEVLMVE